MDLVVGSLIADLVKFVIVATRSIEFLQLEFQAALRTPQRMLMTSVSDALLVSKVTFLLKEDLFHFRTNFAFQIWFFSGSQLLALHSLAY
jgi:hypothetical protein